MVWKVLSLLGIAVLGLSDARPPISEQKVRIESYGKSKMGSQKAEHREVYVWSYPSYEFTYEVADPHTHDFKGQHETRNGDEVKGYYWLIQPDGLKRTVKYRADKNSGLKAQVEYAKLNYKESNENNNESENESEENGGGEEENSNNNQNEENEQEGENENENNEGEENNEDTGEENNNEETADIENTWEKGNKKRVKTEYSIIIQHPKYKQKSKKSKRLI